MANKYVITLSCPDQAGILSAISAYLFENNCNILDNRQFVDLNNHLFIRLLFQIEAKSGLRDRNELHLMFNFEQVAAKFAMKWSIHRSSAKPKTLILISRTGYCLEEIIHHAEQKTLPMEIVGIISDHKSHHRPDIWRDLRYDCLPATANNQAEREEKIISIIKAERVDLVVLAPYWPELSPSFRMELHGRCISVQPFFHPDSPPGQAYEQAYQRGVKLIGATAHYLAADALIGPIIEQDMQTLDHSVTPEQLTELGHAIESRTLIRAMKYHLERRVLINGNRTVVFK